MNHQQQPIPWMQRLFENVWFLTALGVIFPTLMYTVWGLIDLVILPQFTP